jgi:hypothetical protein
MTLKRVSGAALVFVLMLSGSAVVSAADGPGWTYVEAGYLGVDVDNLQGTGNNWFAGGAFGWKSIHLIGQYSNGDAADNVERTDWRLGVGWHGLLGEKADLLAEVAWVDTEWKDKTAGGFGAISDDGYRLTVGARWRPIGLFEADGFVHYTDYDRGGSDTSYEIRAIINIWKVGIGAGYEVLDNASQYNAFARFTF